MVRDMFFGAPCPLCGRIGSVPCDGCVAALPGPPREVDVPIGLDDCRVMVSYFDGGKDLVGALKFHNQRVLVPWLAGQLAGAVGDNRVDVVTWAPTARSHRRARGFDQAEQLARAVARCLLCPAEKTLVRLPGPAQTGRHRSERLVGPRFDSCRGIVRAVGAKRVALVDDVITTGATMSRAAQVLRDCGAVSIIGVAIARTPRHPHRNLSQNVSL